MRIYDISLSISPKLPVWPGDPGINVERVEKMEEGADANVTRMELGVHTGTHVDAPFHFLGGDAITIEALDLKILTGRVYVLHLLDVSRITAQVLENAGIPLRTKRLILRTRNSDYWSQGVMTFQTDFVAITADGAEYLVDRGIKLVGVDYLSVAPFNEGIPTHRILLNSGVVILEGLDVSHVSQGRYTLYCLPLKIAGSDGAPARVILVGA